MTDPPPERPGDNFWDRLRRRKVAQWGLAFAALAWLALQILALVVESYDWSHTVMRAGIGIAITGLALVVVAAWFHGDRGAQRVGALEAITLAAVTLLGGTFAWWTLGTGGRAPRTTEAPAAPAANSTEQRPSIAVLPFENRSTGSDDAFFADGMHDDILTRLARIGALKVISRSSVERFRKTDLGARQIASQLGVTTLLEGGVQRAGNVVRISVQLIDARTDSQLWAETYDRQLSAANIFKIQSEVAESIVAALKTSLTPEERARATQAPTQNLDAWRYYQLGRQKLAERTAAGFLSSEAYFRKAIAADPGFAPAYAGLSQALSIGIGYTERKDHPLKQAEVDAQQALRLDPALSDAWLAAGLISMDRGELAEAEGYFRRAIELEPSNAMARKFYGGALIETHGVDVGAAQLAIAAKLDPLSAIIQVNLGDALETLGKPAEAEACFRRAIELDPVYANAYGAYAGLLTASVDRYAEAEPLLRKSTEIDPDSPRRWLDLAYYYLELGDTHRFTEMAATARQRWPTSPDVELALATLAMMNGDAASIALHAGRVFRLQPGNAESLGDLRYVYLRDGRPGQALELYRKSYADLVASANPKVTRHNADVALDIAVLLMRMGHADQARTLLAGVAATLAGRPRLGKISGYGIMDALIYAASGDRRRALGALREAQQAGWHDGWIYFRDYEPALDSIRADPEFKDIFARIQRAMERQRQALEVGHTDSDRPAA